MTNTMKMLPTAIKIESAKTGNKINLMAIDTENKKILVNTGKGKETKILAFATAANYKYQGRALTSVLLAALLDSELAKTKTPDKGVTVVQPAPKKKAPREKDPKYIASDENCISVTCQPDPNNQFLCYIEDLAQAVGYTSKVLRKKLRTLEAEGIIVKTAHTWCWENLAALDPLIEYLIKEDPKGSS